MQALKKSETFARVDSMETPGVSCSSPYCSLYRIRRSQSLSEAREDILNVSPRPSHCNPNLRLNRRLHGRSSLCISENTSQSSCRNYMASTEVRQQKSATELIKEISTLEIEVLHLERYLLSLYRTTFDQYLTSSPSNTTQASRSPVQHHTGPVLQDTNRIPIEHQESHASSSYYMNDEMDQSRSLERNEMKSDSNCRRSEDSPAHDIGPVSDASSGPSLREDPKYDDPSSTMPGHQNLADLLGTTIADHVPQTPSKLSEDIIRCICSIYCKLATPPTQQMDLFSSPTPSASSSSTLSPGDARDSWSPRCHYEATTSPSSFDSPKNKQSPYSNMIEVPRLSIDGDRFGYASNMLNIFRSLIRRLDKIKPEKMDHEEQLAFWINIHNALVMHAFLAYGLHQNQMKSNFSILKAAYDIGGHSVNAYDIQSSILGCQLHRPATGLRTLLLPSMKLKKGKDKHPYALKNPEPLSHFALCLGAYSDPAIRAYKAKNIYGELKLAKEEFVQANVSIQKESKITMPKILGYYARDASLDLFALVEMCSDCMPDEARKRIQGCIFRRKLDKCVEWSPYKSSFRYLVHRDLAKH
ncbi:uncharacterized protein LOC109843732 [Asparagus officinalis]|nr:uncharacterized protein LOC109843732 [Asparagus officinalis]